MRYGLDDATCIKTIFKTIKTKYLTTWNNNQIRTIMNKRMTKPKHQDSCYYYTRCDLGKQLIKRNHKI